MTKATLLSQSQYARRRGKSRQYIGKLAKAGVLVMRGGLVDAEASDQVLDGDAPTGSAAAEVTAPESHYQEPAPVPSMAGGTWHQARTADKVYQARLRRLEFEKAQGKLIDADVIRKELVDANRALRDGLLAIGPRLAPILAAEMDQKKIEAMLVKEIRRELETQASVVDAI